MSIKASDHPGVSREPFITPKTETLTIWVTETVTYLHTFEVTEGLLDEAEYYGCERTPDGVLDMLMEDVDHEIVSNDATRPANFTSVSAREVWRG